MTMTTPSSFSYFHAPITNTRPAASMTLQAIYDMIRSPMFLDRTVKLRAIDDLEAARTYKAKHLDYVTFSGTFTARNDASLEKHSGYMVFDFDHVENLTELRQILLNDPCIHTQMLFTSPSGKGLKWVIHANIGSITHRVYFGAVSNYLKQTYGLKVDPSGKDISRACFLCYDPEAFIKKDTESHSV